MRRLGHRLRDHRGLVALLTLHAAGVGATFLTGSPFATASVECAAGGVAELLLSPGQRPWGPLDSFDGALGGNFVAALVALPLFAGVGVTAWAAKGVAWAFSAAVLLVVYGLLDRHESRGAALLGTAALAFAPPAVSFMALILGNWHWTELMFDYGVALAALELLRAHRPGLERETPGPGSMPWAGLGLLTGFGVVNCFGSLPFMAVGWAALLVGLGMARVLPLRLVPRRLGIAAGAALLGAAPLLVKALWHTPFGVDGPRADGGLPGMLRFGFDPSKLADLVGPPLAWSLHVQDLLPSLPQGVAWGLAGAWVALAWCGVVACLALTGRRIAAGAPVAGGLIPVLFVGTFALAYVAVGMRIEVLPPEFSNLRETTHRPLLPLVAALALAGAVGWSRIMALARGGPVWLRVGLGGVALAPVALGIVTSVAGALDPSGAGVGTVSVYRSSCLDVGGFVASPWYADDPAALHERCGEWVDPSRVRQCRAGAAWGAGYYRGRLARGAEGARSEPRPGGPEGPPMLAAGSTDGCDALPAGMRGDCLRGIGWLVGERDWGTGRWPLPSCDALPSPDDRAGCWRGVGFLVGDHLHPTPWRMDAVLRRVPRDRRADVAQGAGYSMARTYASTGLPGTLCGRLGGDLVGPCRAGVAEAAADR